MPGRNYVKSFTIDSLEYEMVVTRDLQVAFRLTGGRFKNGDRVLFYEDSFYHNASQYCVSNRVGNPLKVIRSFFALTVEYFAVYRPPYLWFNSFEVNRARVYGKLLKKLPKFCEAVAYGENEAQFLILPANPTATRRRDYAAGGCGRYH